MPRKKPRVVSLDEVKITREGDAVEFEYADGEMGSMHLTLGFDVTKKSDAELLAYHNDVVRTMEDARATYEHVAVEVPIGSPQIEYFDRGDQWVPRGDVLRCVVHDGGRNGEATVEIDERELTLEEFGRMLTTYAGWGMRIVFVPDDEIHLEPTVEVREPASSDPGSSPPDERAGEPAGLPAPRTVETLPVPAPPPSAARTREQRHPLRNQRPTTNDQRLRRRPIYQLRVALIGIEPPIWRRVLVSGNCSLRTVHRVLQAAMGWTNSHLHIFTSVDHRAAVSDPRFELDGARDESRVKLRTFAPAIGDRFHYEYDLGDGWEHEVLVEDILAPQDARQAPCCLAGARACPPEDCGGIPGYFELVAAMKDRLHPERTRHIEWLGREYDAERFDQSQVNQELRRVK